MGFSHYAILFHYKSHVKILNKIKKTTYMYHPYFESPYNLKHTYFLGIFYAPEGTLGGILKSHHPSVHPSVTNRVSAIHVVNLMKLHRKIKHHEKVCRAHDFGSYAQGQGCNQVRGQNCVAAITKKLLKQF